MQTQHDLALARQRQDTIKVARLRPPPPRYATPPRRPTEHARGSTAKAPSNSPTPRAGAPAPARRRPGRWRRPRSPPNFTASPPSGFGIWSITSRRSRRGGSSAGRTGSPRLRRRSSAPTPAAGSRNSDSTAPSTICSQRSAAYGVAIFAQDNSYTSGELGYYVRRLAEAGLVAFAATNGPALMTVPGGKTPIYCTNPLPSPRRSKTDRRW